MRFPIFLALFLLAGGVEAVSIESAVYDLELNKDRLEGFGLIKGTDVGEIEFSSSWQVGVLERGENMLVLELSRNLSNHDVEIPLLAFPHKVEKTMVGVDSRDKFVWDVDFDFYSVEGDRVLARSDVKDTQIRILDEHLSYLKNFSGSKLPGNRLYLGAISPGEEVVLRGHTGNGYEYYLALGVIALCALLLYAFYLVSKRLTPKEEDKGEGIEKEDTGEDIGVKRERWEKILDELEGDEYVIYAEILNEDGEICQRDLPERTGFSKAKVSRILDKLEHKAMVKRESYGMTNLVVLR